MPQSLLIATFSLWQKGERTSINGMVEPLLSYFLPKVENLDLIDGFHPGSSDTISQVDRYKRGTFIQSMRLYTSLLMRPILLLQNTNGTKISFKIRDFLSTIEWGIRSKTTYDVFIGLESVYTLAGIVLKKMGLTKSVIYYVSDYSPNRFPQKWINDIYLFLDRICATHADYIWDVSPAIQKGRIQAGLDPTKSAPVIIVSNALFPSQISYAQREKRIPYSLVFAGTLGLENGPDIAIFAINLLKKDYPKIQLHVFGGNEQGKETYLKELTKKLHLESYVSFHGFVHDAQTLSRNISQFMIGLAPYKEQKGSVRAFGDATKLRLYMGAGLPTITTSVPPLGKEIQKKGAALIVKDDEQAFAEGIKRVFETNTYKKMRKNAIGYGKNNTWENTYSQAFQKMKIASNRK